MAFKFSKSLCRFCRQHRRKFIFVGVFVGGVYGMIKFAEYKIKDHFLQEQQKANNKLKIQRNFQQIKQHSLSIASAMLVEAMESIKLTANTEKITEMLKSGQGDKLTLWQDLKIMVFTRIVTGVSTVVLTLLVLQIQLNQIAGILVLTSSDDQNNLNSEQQKFLSAIFDHIVKHGITDLACSVKKVVADQLESMPLQAMYSAKDLETTLNSICSALFQNSVSLQNKPVKLSQFAIASNFNLEDWTVIPTSNISDIEHWLAKTSDILDSPDFEVVSFDCIKMGLGFLGRELSSAISSSVSVTSMSYLESDDFTAPLAKLLPILNAQLPLICSKQFLEIISDNSILNQFLLNVCESFALIE